MLRDTSSRESVSRIASPPVFPFPNSHVAVLPTLQMACSPSGVDLTSHVFSGSRDRFLRRPDPPQPEAHFRAFRGRVTVQAGARFAASFCSGYCASAGKGLPLPRRPNCSLNTGRGATALDAANERSFPYVATYSCCTARFATLQSPLTVWSYCRAQRDLGFTSGRRHRSRGQKRNQRQSPDKFFPVFPRSPPASSVEPLFKGRCVPLSRG